VKQYTAKRNEYIFQAREQGMDWDDIGQALRDAGSYNYLSSTIQTFSSEHKRKIGLTETRKKPKPSAPMPKFEADTDQMIVEILAVVQRHMGDIKTKADKWDAIKDLVAGE